MSINTSHANGGVLIFAGERILLYCDGVELGFEPIIVPQFKGNKNGTLFLTTHRVIFRNRSHNDMLQSFSLPFLQMRGVELEQPVFGANYIKGKMIAEQGGNWTGEGKFKIWFKTGGAIEFGQAMLRAGQLASRNRPVHPPAYTSPQGPFYQAPPPAYSAPHTEYYAWVPYQTFPTAPPPEYVYMCDAPPPYPGVDTAYAHSQAMNKGFSSADAKAKEATGCGYYNPASPHNVYIPAMQPSAPPSYEDATKKYQ